MEADALLEDALKSFLANKKLSRRFLFRMRKDGVIPLLVNKTKLISLNDPLSKDQSDLLGLLTVLCTDYDISTEFARLGGHTLIKNLANSTIEDIINSAHCIIGSILASDCRFPGPAGVDATDLNPKNLPSKFTYHTSQDVSYDIYIQSIPGTMHGIGQEAVGGIIWPSAVVLSNYLLRERHLVLERRILEIGAGVGLAGLVCGSLGALSIVLSDTYEKVLENLLVNVELNSGDVLVDGKTAAIGESTISVRSFDWSKLDETSIEGSQFLGMHPFDHSLKDIDLLIGSDLICCKEDAFNVATVISLFFAHSKSQCARAIFVIGTELNRFGIEYFLPSLCNTGLHVHSAVLQHSQCSLTAADADVLALCKSGVYDYLFDGLSSDLLDCTSFLFVACTRS